MNSFTFKAIGTTWNINISADISNAKEEKLIEDIMERIDIFDKTYSRFKNDSLVANISKKAGKYVLPNDAKPMLSLYQKLYEITDGAMSPLVGQVLSDAGYDTDYSLKPKKNIPPAPMWDEIIEYKHPILHIKKPALLDFGAIGKGYLVDIVGNIITKHGIMTFTVDAGGDILYKNENKKPLRVGLENPENQKQVVGIANINDRSICGSASNRRRWKNYHHIINPKTVKSPEHILALWTVAENTMLADALSTALFFVEPEILLQKFKFDYAILYADHSARVSSAFPGHFFGAEKIV